MTSQEASELVNGDRLILNQEGIDQGFLGGNWRQPNPSRYGTFIRMANSDGCIRVRRDGYAAPDTWSIRYWEKD